LISEVIGQELRASEYLRRRRKKLTECWKRIEQEAARRLALRGMVVTAKDLLPVE